MWDFIHSRPHNTQSCMWTRTCSRLVFCSQEIPGSVQEASTEMHLSPRLLGIGGKPLFWVGDEHSSVSGYCPFTFMFICPASNSSPLHLEYDSEIVSGVARCGFRLLLFGREIRLAWVYACLQLAHASHDSLGHWKLKSLPFVTFCWIHRFFSDSIAAS